MLLFNYARIKLCFIVSCRSTKCAVMLLRGEAFYPGVDTLGVQEHKDKPEAIDRMVTDLEKQ